MFPEIIRNRPVLWKATVIVLMVVIVVVAAVIIGSLQGFRAGPGNEVPSESELHNVATALAAMMAHPNVPVEDLETDQRIVGYENDPSQPTNIMTNGGLVTIAVEYLWSGTELFKGGPGDKVAPLCEYLEHGTTTFFYITDSKGHVRGFFDRNGKKEIK